MSLCLKLKFKEKVANVEPILENYFEYNLSKEFFMEDKFEKKTEKIMNLMEAFIHGIVCFFLKKIFFSLFSSFINIFNSILVRMI